MAKNIYSDCVAVPANCEYIDMPGNYLPFTDTYVPEVADLEGCRAECNNQQGYNCRWLSGDISTIYYAIYYLLIYLSTGHSTTTQPGGSASSPQVRLNLILRCDL